MHPGCGQGSHSANPCWAGGRVWPGPGVPREALQIPGGSEPQAFARDWAEPGPGRLLPPRVRGVWSLPGWCERRDAEGSCRTGFAAVATPEVQGRGMDWAGAVPVNSSVGGGEGRGHRGSRESLGLV